VAREALEAAVAEGTFAPGDHEFLALQRLLETLDSTAPRRPAVYSALVGYIIALYREARFSATNAAIAILEMLWDPTCQARDRLYAAYFRGLVLIRGAHPRESSRDLPIALALLARAEHEFEFVALAGVLQQTRVFLSGNLPLTISLGEKRLRQLARHPSDRAEGQFIHQIAAAHGRAGRPEQVLRLASTLLQSRFPDSTNFGALNLIGTAFIDLGDLNAACAAYELMLLAPSSNQRRVGALGLMDIHARRMERKPFERIYEHLVNQPFAVDARIYFWQVAGRGWAKLGDLTRARECFERGHAFAQQFGMGYEIFEMEAMIDELPDPAKVARASDIAPEIAAHVTALRDSHAEEIAACLT
jgi:hypothetical protein